MFQQNKPDTLYGLRRWNDFSKDGSVSADTYFMGLPAEQVGQTTMKGEKVLFFFDAAKRDQFRAIFGGESLTMHKERAQTVSGERAVELMNRMGGARG